MIRPLRRRHRVTFFALTVLLPVAFGAGMAARKSGPATASPPPTLSVETPRFDTVLWERDDLWEQMSVRLRFTSDEAGRLAVTILPKLEIIRPDLIVYWAPGPPKLDGKLADDAIFLGALNRNGALRWPANATGQEGTLLLYSLADHEIVAASKSFEALKN
jgi:hypothetical protein